MPRRNQQRPPAPIPGPGITAPRKRHENFGTPHFIIAVESRNFHVNPLLSPEECEYIGRCKLLAFQQYGACINFSGNDKREI